MKIFKKVDWLLKTFEEVAEETEKETSPEKFQTWIDFHSYWIDLWKWLNQSLGDEWMNSLLLWRATELNKHLLFHNHPSGHPEPSEEDRRLTRAIAEAARTLDIRVLDHIVVGKDGYVSFMEDRLLPGAM